MAIAVIVGILFATFLTLLLVPVLYSMADDLAAWFGRIYAPPAAIPAVAGAGTLHSLGGNGGAEHAGQREEEGAVV
ncbi:hypothetical protein D3C83_158670 [compost metagenome]